MGTSIKGQEQCDICITTFNKTPSGKRAKCPYCDVKSCVKCVQTYLLNSYDDPHCMGCRKGWSREVLDDILLKTWRNSEYKKHRQNILLDREKSRLPMCQLVIERQKESEKRKPHLEELRKIMEDARIKYAEAERAFYAENAIIQVLASGREPATPGGGHSVASTEKKEPVRAFIMRCPVSDCRGFLSSAYKCGICDMFTCPECREVKGTNRDSEHTCKPEAVANVNLLKKECRNCPECAASIFKIDGCHQMFCTNCKTPFDWKTGQKITTGAIHNPHYFEYLRATNGGAVPRTPGDVPCGVRNLPSGWILNDYLRDPVIQKNEKYDNKIHKNFEQILTFIQSLNHIRYEEADALRNTAADSDNTDINVRYLRKEITEIRWKQLLQMREKRRMRREEIRQRYNALFDACVDIMSILPTKQRGYIWNSENINKIYKITDDILIMSKNIIEIYNKGILSVSERYNTKVSIITPEFGRIQTKLEMKKVAKKKIIVKKGAGVGAEAGATTLETDSDSDTSNE